MNLKLFRDILCDDIYLKKKKGKEIKLLKLEYNFLFFVFLCNFRLVVFFSNLRKSVVV